MFYCKCVCCGIDCGWLIRTSFRKNKYYWELMKYNDPHTCTRARISQDHTKLDSDTIAECIKPTVESDPSFMIKSMIAKIQSRYGYTTMTEKRGWQNKRQSKKYSVSGKPYLKLCHNGVQQCVMLFEDQLFSWMLQRPTEKMSQFRTFKYYTGCFRVSIIALEHLDTANHLCRLMGHICMRYKGALLVAVHKIAIRTYCQLLLLLLKVRLQMHGIFFG